MKRRNFLKTATSGLLSARLYPFVASAGISSNAQYLSDGADDSQEPEPVPLKNTAFFGVQGFHHYFGLRNHPVEVAYRYAFALYYQQWNCRTSVFRCCRDSK